MPFYTICKKILATGVILIIIFHINQTHVYTGCAKKKKGILNIHIKSEGINIFSQKFCWIE